MSLYHLRWHLTNLLFRLGLFLAPRGAARDLLISYLERFHDEIMGGINVR